MIPHFKSQFTRALASLAEEVSKFGDEKELWMTAGTISNSSGNLTLHLVGNINHFIGAQLGLTGYVRQRDKEFSEKNVSKEKLIAMINNASKTAGDTFDSLNVEDLVKIYPLDTFGPEKTTHEVLLHLLSHFQYHLGQINYLRRVVSPVAL
jgi:hypothetical protein